VPACKIICEGESDLIFLTSEIISSAVFPESECLLTFLLDNFLGCIFFIIESPINKIDPSPLTSLFVLLDSGIINDSLPNDLDNSPAALGSLIGPVNIPNPSPLPSLTDLLDSSVNNDSLRNT
jgi:hypothetical protein